MRFPPLLKSFIHKCTPRGLNMTSTWSCYNGTEAAQGVELLKKHGDQTNTIDLSFVPSIEVDNVSWVKKISSKFVGNLKTNISTKNTWKVLKQYFHFRNFHTTKIGRSFTPWTGRYANAISKNSMNNLTTAIKTNNDKSFRVLKCFFSFLAQKKILINFSSFFVSTWKF